MTTATDKLLPCPFCGGEAITEVLEPHQHKLATWMPDYKGGEFVSCTSCSAMTSSVADWNARHNPDANALKIAVEALRSIAESSYDYMTGKHSDETAEEALAKIEREAEKKGE